MFSEFFADYTTSTLIILSALAFVAGFIDAVVGGGGLIQIPALLIAFPNAPVATIFGTNKIAALAGTSVAAFNYARKIVFDFRLLFVISLCCSISSFTGARIVSLINVNVLKPIILFILIAIAVYTFFKKDLGSIKTKELSFQKQLFYGGLIGLVIGFYDGFFGPGTGSFFVLAFVVVLGFEFVQASAYAKIVNCITNISALIVFIRQGNYMLELALIMAAMNIAGNIIGSKLALRKGNDFVRIIFLVVVSLMIFKYGWEVFAPGV
ncbi:TSUP family transporter [Dyadobacter sp. CY345]|uniref:sulfite exporter TauE/SafE family protein n=1 Tax=Dyadobacter sp. CY345 TaxID=2909335 RepID=UPI001F2168DC|nr:TSUP family transporter [Dyadobacter sp. CY345]MCF2443799.1 TSUP family transporter [Dyadobacter sp. CY345]